MTSMVKSLISILMVVVASSHAYASIAIGRTRVVFDAENQTQSFKIKNKSSKPYLVQSWIEDELGEKASEPFVMLPPVQRIEANGDSQIKIQSLSSITKLPQDRESVFYINILEIPPKSNEANQVQLAVQSHIKLFYRPQSLKIDRVSDVIPGVEKMTFSCSNGKAKIVNPTNYFITLSAGGDWVMISPKSEGLVNYRYGKGNLSIVYINDYGVKKSLKNEAIRSGGGCNDFKSK